MARPPIWDPLWQYLETDVGFYLAIALGTILVFVVSLVFVAVISPVDILNTGFVGLVVGFLLFMLVFVAAVGALRLEDEETDP